MNDPTATTAVPTTGADDATARPGRWQRWTEPRPDGLPRARVLLAFPAAVLLALVTLVSLGISGSSSGVVHDWFETGADPDLLLLKPQAIRSDEWIVQTVWTVSQVEEGLPLRNEAMPGGVDMSMLWEVPYAEWSAAFRPHNLGFFFLPLDNAFALKWWLPGAALAVACSMFLTSLWPRRPGSAALVSVGFFVAPFFQWWYLPQTLWPAAWALLLMTGVIWVSSGASRGHRWTWAAVVGYVSVTAALGIYAPFLVPSAYVAAFFALGWVLRRDADVPVTTRLRRLLPLGVAAAAAAAVMVVFLLTRWDTVTAFLETVYPGQRLTEAGAGLDDPDKEASFAGAFGLALRDGSSYGLRPNASEASTFVFVGAFLAAVGIWLLVRQRRRRLPLDRTILYPLICGVVLVAFLYVPGWDVVAHLLLLDRVTPGRMLIGLGLLSIVLIGVTVRALDAEDLRAPWWLAGGLGAVVVVAHLVLWRVLSDRPAVLAAAGPWIVIVLAFALSVVLFARRRVAAAAGLFLLVSGVVGGWVNPLYRGVFDLRETDVAQAVEAQDEENPGRWIGVGDAMVGPILTETGVDGFNAFQGAPNAEMWSELDPSGRYELNWNRFANVGWSVDPDQPRIWNPAGDQIRVSFDSCAPFEQSIAENVLSDRPIDQPCLELQSTVQAPLATYHLYTITPPA
ncbi:DUF7657 domain-containing protein [Cellulomonas biazotea]|uniref:Glycosyltransferase RgtA/B/C/D-like domain-containing protein n=1 Tax=Cellulomonas biazotea TaxID=1709 RepID=A0A402DU80_9CELL|nr:hypothetical protein [Cellulomonas biazotea]GCE77700.1 hypothetical protein CBZ_27560 [Cellulomonas biazotea]